MGWRHRIQSSYKIITYLNLLGLVLVTALAACSPVAATTVCMIDKDCPAGTVCQQGACVEKNAFACSGDTACQDALASGSWTPANNGPCMLATCKSSACKLVNRDAGAECDDGDGKACTLGACGSDGKCAATTAIKTDSCLISDACVASGASNASDAADGACQVCDPKASQTEWSAAADGAPCADDKVTCTEDKCKAKLCNHDVILKTQCRIGGECLASGAAKSDNPCEVCEPAASQSEWSAAPADTPCASDGKDCTIDSCKGKTCDSSGINDKGCLIASTCIPANTPKPDAPCLVCDPSQSKTDWSPAKLGTACADSLDCTVDSCDGKGSCDSSTLKTDTCLVQDGGKPRCMAKGEPQSSDLTCQVCDPTKNSKELSVLNDDAACIPGKPCLLGKCKAGTCENKGANPDSCLIAADNACVAAKDLNPNNPCQACDPSVSQTVWTDLAAAIACPTDGIDCTADHCDGGGKCLHELQNSACTAKDSACTTGVCDASQGCVAMPKDSTVVCEGDGVACTVEVCDGKSNCNLTGTPTDKLCDDKVACTLDTCDAVKGCVHTAKDTACSDGNECTADMCDVTAGCSNPPLSSGSPCKLDDLACTNDACQAGSCVAPIAGGNCLIAGVCYGNGEKTAGECSWCNSGEANDKWTVFADGLACLTDNQPCTDDKCAAGQCTHPANTLPCTDDNVACTLDICSGGGCQHQAQANKCDDGLPCTDNQCDVKAGDPITGCLFVDNCAYGHECSQTAKACLTLGGVAFELVKTSPADPSPTNAALGRHDLDSTGNSQRTWVAWQSQSCATVVGGAWNITQGSQLRAMALDPQIAAVKAPPTTVNLPQAALWNGSSTVCQAFPTIATDPKLKTQLWLSWLESDPSQPTAAKQCLSNGGQGGVWRVARLDGSTASGKVAAAGEVCATPASFGPLFLTAGLAPLDGNLSDVADISKRTFLSLRTLGGNLGAWTDKIALHAAPGTFPLPAAAFGPGGAMALVHPVLADFGTDVDSQKRYLAIAATDNGSVRGLWANYAKADGSQGAAELWATTDPAVAAVFTSTTAVCSLDAAVDDKGTLGVVVVTRKGGNDRVELITRTAGGVTAVSTVNAPGLASQGPDCRLGVTGARLTATTAGWLTTTFASNNGEALKGTVQVYRAGNMTSFTVPKSPASTTDNANETVNPPQPPSTALAWRGLTQTLMTGSVMSAVLEVVSSANARGIMIWTRLP